MIQFRHLRLNRYHCALLEDLMERQDAPGAAPMIVLDELDDDERLRFQPSLRRAGYHPELLAKLAEHGLVDLTRAGDQAYRVYVTPIGRDYYDDMCALT